MKYYKYNREFSNPLEDVNGFVLGNVYPEDMNIILYTRIDRKKVTLSLKEYITKKEGALFFKEVPNPFQEPYDELILKSRKVDMVNEPPHYKNDKSGIECIEITRHRNFNIGNAIKYLWRSGLKQDSDKSTKAKEIEDLNKAIWYINDEIKRIENENITN